MPSIGEWIHPAKQIAQARKRLFGISAKKLELQLLEFGIGIERLVEIPVQIDINVITKDGSLRLNQWDLSTRHALSDIANYRLDISRGNSERDTSDGIGMRRGDNVRDRGLQKELLVGEVLTKEAASVGRRFSSKSPEIQGYVRFKVEPVTLPPESQ